MLLVWGAPPMLAFPNWSGATAAPKRVSGFPSGMCLSPDSGVLQFGTPKEQHFSGLICKSLHGKGLLVE